ncbi:MAG: alpha/beta hydrolase [Planctomycetes bacterium]|nr:alpha/beta hydrolase [Planctomycetota bacterium]
MRLVTPEAEPPRAVDRLESRSPPLAAVAPPKPVPATHAVVRTWFGTNRSLNATPEAGPSDRFEAGRSDLRWGTCDVSIPRDHRMGEVERPSVWRFEFSEDPDAHVTVLATETTTHADWLTSVREKIAAANSHNAFIFVHGYNVSFADAARRTAQISYDLGFEGAPVFFTWPSQGDASSYTKDEQAIEWAQTDIRAFIESFLAESGAENVYIVAHSMGNRGVTRALAALMKEQPVLAGRITEIILAAPDIDADVFRRDIAPALISAGRPVTLYASSDDVALAASKTVHGFARAGDAGAGLVVVKGIDTIDATGVDASFLGHSYFADVGSVLRDLFELINDRKRPDARPGLVKCESEGRVHWTLGR